MSVETLSRPRFDFDDDMPDMQEFEDDFARGYEEIPDAYEPHSVLIVGGGANTEHMGEALERLNRTHPVHVAEVREPLIPVSPDRLHLVNTEEGRARLTQLIASGAIRAVYGSIVPSMHEGFLTDYLQEVGNGNIGFVVIAKPAVGNVAEMKRIDAAKKAAEDQLRLLHGPDYNPEDDPILYVHEHYMEKGPWHVLREQLPLVAERLGRLSKVTINIEEARTAESEDRVAAFSGGALEDLGPHVISLGLNIQSSINTTGRYEIPNYSKTTVERFRYDNSELPEGVETGFIVHGETTIIDHENSDTSHELPFTWQGGKGLVDKKEAILEFIHPDTEVKSVIRVDLRHNTLEVPESIRDLFPETEFEENGYGYVIESGLNGGDPRKSFQHWDEARIVTKWQAHLRAQKNEPLIYRSGMSLQQLAES